MSGLLNKLADEMEKKVEERLNKIEASMAARFDAVEKKIDKLLENNARK